MASLTDLRSTDPSSLPTDVSELTTLIREVSLILDKLSGLSPIPVGWFEEANARWTQVKAGHITPGSSAPLSYFDWLNAEMVVAFPFRPRQSSSVTSLLSYTDREHLIRATGHFIRAVSVHRPELLAEGLVLPPNEAHLLKVDAATALPINLDWLYMSFISQIQRPYCTLHNRLAERRKALVSSFLEIQCAQATA